MSSPAAGGCSLRIVASLWTWWAAGVGKEASSWVTRKARLQEQHHEVKQERTSPSSASRTCRPEVSFLSLLQACGPPSKLSPAGQFYRATGLWTHLPTELLLPNATPQHAAVARAELVLDRCAAPGRKGSKKRESKKPSKPLVLYVLFLPPQFCFEDARGRPGVRSRTGRVREVW